ncbi:MAG: hypothetical protein PHH83_04430 [Patescibacteria group bacterium]|nr:hypothetical protein [Patescibacteria group bacterium]
MEQEQEKKLLFGTTVKHFNTFDMTLLKLALMTFTLFIVSLWPAFANWVINTSWVWFFFAWIIFMLKPLIKAWKK